MGEELEGTGQEEEVVGATVGYRTPADVSGGQAEEDFRSSDRISPERFEPAEEDDDATHGREGFDEEDEDLDYGDGEGENKGKPTEDKFKVHPELKEEYERMKHHFSELSKDVGALRLKAQVVDAIEADPEATILALAEQYGITLPGGGDGSDQREEEFSLDVKELAPKKDEDMASFIGRTVHAYMQDIPKMVQKAVEGTVGKRERGNKVVAGAQNLSQARVRATIEYLDRTYNDWGLYEKRMIQLVQRHPTLAQDPDELYKLAKASSSNVRDRSRALKGKGKTRTVRTTVKNRGRVDLSRKRGKMAFLDAFNAAVHDVRTSNRRR